MDEPINASATATIITALALSVVAIVVTSFRRAEGRPLLPQEPRQRVPWGIVATIVPLYCMIDPFIRALFSETTPEIDIDPAEFVLNGLAYALVMIGFVIVAMPWLVVVCGATTRDLGLPTTTRQLGRDVGIGAFACLVSLLPIYSVQFILTAVLQPEQEHQLIEQIIEHKSSQMLLVGAVMAVIAAPIFEEFTFRLLLQGWLERREDEILGIQESTRQPMPALAEPQTEVVTESVTELDALANPPAIPLVTSELPDEAAIRPTGTLFNLPHGWSPILISSLAFGLAHFGHGVAPIPLVLFGIVLGYLYQRTHRLAASITAHALFNAYSMGILWLQIR